MKTIKTLLAVLVLLQCVGLGMWYHGLYVYTCPDYGGGAEKVGEMEVKA